jgi:signal transduction histidine kinase
VIKLIQRALKASALRSSRFIDWLDALPGKSAHFRYGVTTVLVLATLAARFALDPYLGDQLSFTFFRTTAILIALVGWFGPALYAMLTGWVLADYFFVLPRETLLQYEKLEWTLIVSSLLPGVLILIIIQALHRSRRSGKAEIQRRQKAEAELLAAQEQLHQHASDLEKLVEARTEELQKSVHFLEGFCYSIAHELRAPLRAINGFLQILDDECGIAIHPQGREYSEKIFGATNRMGHLIADLLQYGRLSHEKISVAEVGLEDVFPKVLQRLRSTIQSSQAIVQVTHPLPKLRANPQLLELALFHLVSNALKFQRANVTPVVGISAETGESRLRILVQDNGAGIEAKYQKKIFKLFGQLDPSSSRSTGIGLATVKQAMDRMNGQVGVESRPGEGSTFWIELPKCSTS